MILSPASDFSPRAKRVAPYITYVQRLTIANIHPDCRLPIWLTFAIPGARFGACMTRTEINTAIERLSVLVRAADRLE